MERFRALATRVAWSREFATEMRGSSPEPDAVTASTGTSAARARPFSLRYSTARCCTSARKYGLVGPKFEPELMSWLRSCGSPLAVPEAAAPAELGRPWKYFAPVNV